MVDIDYVIFAITDIVDMFDVMRIIDVIYIIDTMCLI